MTVDGVGNRPRVGNDVQETFDLNLSRPLEGKPHRVRPRPLCYLRPPLFLISKHFAHVFSDGVENIFLFQLLRDSASLLYLVVHEHVTDSLQIDVIEWVMSILLFL